MVIDTNVLVYASVPGAPNRARAQAALNLQATSGERLFITRQILREFVAVITRPQAWAQAKTPREAASFAASLAGAFGVLEDGEPIWQRLLMLCRQFSFGGRQVHDANIVATMLAHGERRLLTFNEADFRRFIPLIEIIVP